MPYTTNADLPEDIKNHLPDHAQTIFREAFNNAHEQYGEEETAFKVAWSAVKNEYEKNAEGEWVKKG
jgi:cation transport regulator